MNRRQADVRLLLPAAACWVGALGGAAAGGWLALAVTFIAMAWALLLARRGVSLLLAGCLLTTSAGVWVAAVARHAATTGPLSALARHGAVAEMVVQLSGDPVVRDGRSRRTGRAYHLVITPARVLRLSSGGESWALRRPVTLLATDDAWASLVPSQRAHAVGALARPQGGEPVDAVVDVRGPPTRVGPPSGLQATASKIRAALRGAARGLPAGTAGLLPGLVDGDTSALPAATATQFRRTGLTHLVAVSGTNVAIVAGVVLGGATRLRLRPRLAAAAVALAILGFVVLARPSPSVLRAAVMGLLAIAGLVARRPRPALGGLCATVLVLLCTQPSLSRSAGFALSTLATLGLLVLAPGWQQDLQRRLPGPVASLLAVPAAAQFACAPVIAGIGGGTSLVAIPANILAEPAVAPATILGVVTATVAPVAPGVGHAFAWAASLPCWWLLTVAGVGSRVPLASVSWPAGVGGGLLLAALSPVAVALIRRAGTQPGTVAR